MRAGKRRHLIVIEKLVPTTGSMGQPTTSSWSNVGSAYGNIAPVTGSESFGAQAIQMETTVKIEMNYIGSFAITPKMRARWNGLVYDILAVLNWEMRNKDITLLCKQGVNQG